MVQWKFQMLSQIGGCPGQGDMYFPLWFLRQIQALIQKLTVEHIFKELHSFMSRKNTKLYTSWIRLKSTDYSRKHNVTEECPENALMVIQEVIVPLNLHQAATFINKYKKVAQIAVYKVEV